MAGLVAWLIATGALLIGPISFERKQVRNAERGCRCVCGVVRGDKQDLPPPMSDETREYHRLFGDRIIVCQDLSHLPEADRKAVHAAYVTVLQSEMDREYRRRATEN